MNTLCTKAQKVFQVSVSYLVITLIFSFSTLSAQPDGAKLFKQNCATCHKLDDKKLTGPGLKGVFDRVPKPADAWLLHWVKDNSKVLASGDAYANKILKENNGTQMTVFSFLGDDDIKAILTFVKNPPPETAVANGPKTTGEQTVSESTGLLDTKWILLITASILLMLISILKSVKKSLKNVLNEKEGRSPEPELGRWEEIKMWMVANKTKVAVILIILSCYGSKVAWDGLFSLGVYQGYKPSQPIAFSHKIHAGDNAINCQYCHSGAEKSRHAGIPSVNICMNCHKGIEKGPTTGTSEIAKIYEAAGWSPETQKYDKPQKPIRWVKVHNLQDFVFFSHQQHIKVGKQECETCHGDVKNMTVAQQFAPLTMSWCIDCHRKTEVPGMKDNPYYEELHKKLAEKYKGQPITVAKMGGIECGKCHY